MSKAVKELKIKAFNLLLILNLYSLAILHLLFNNRGLSFYPFKNFLYENSISLEENNIEVPK